MSDAIDSRSFWWAVGLSVVGCSLLVIALFLPPLGVIDASVVGAAGLVFTFSGAIVGINGNVNTKIARMEMEVERRYPRVKEEDEGEVGSPQQSDISQ